jgi:DNA-binding response OmpR family regulator
VLLIEDEPGTARTVERGLIAEGFAVDVADNGVDGLWRATERQYDAVVLDVMLLALPQTGPRRCPADRVHSSRVPATAK